MHGPVLRYLDVIGQPTNLLAYTTPAKFHDANPKLVELFIAALNETNELIAKDPMKASALYLEASEEKLTTEVAAIIEEPGTMSRMQHGAREVRRAHPQGRHARRQAGQLEGLLLPAMHGANGS